MILQTNIQNVALDEKCTAFMTTWANFNRELRVLAVSDYAFDARYLFILSHGIVDKLETIGDDGSRKQIVLKAEIPFSKIPLTSERAEMRAPQWIQVFTSKIFALGFLPLALSTGLRAKSAEAAEILEQVVPIERRDQDRAHALSFLGIVAVQPRDAFVLGADLALNHGYLAVIEKKFTQKVAVIAQGEDAQKIQAWIDLNGLQSRVFVMASVNEVKTKWAGQYLGAFELANGFETGIEKPIIYTEDRLNVIYKHFGLVDEVTQLIHFAPVFASAA